MDLNVADHKCRICSLPDTTDGFIHLTGSKAKIFEYVVCVELKINGVKSESMICQGCFNKLEQFHDFKVRGQRVHQEYLAATHRMSNEPEQAQYEVESSEAADGVESLEDPQLEQPEAKVEPASPSRVKHEPSVDFLLILPPASEQSEDVEKVKRMWVDSVKVRKFDEQLQGESEPFQTFVICHHCHLVMKNQRDLIRHLKACSSINPARFECDYCGKRFSARYLLRPHMQRHSSERRFGCSQCGLRFKTKGVLLRHSRIHDKAIVCTDCQKKFSIHRYLKEHEMQHRHGIYSATPDKTFDCDKCDRKFSIETYLKAHQSKVHKIEEAKCKVCDKICKNRVLLYSHMITHSAKNLVCDHCGYSTNFKENLKKHIERIHLLKKLLDDFKSREDFSDVELLKKLQQLYSAAAPTTCEKKFDCVKCGKPHATLRLMNQHLRQVHPAKLLDCSDCKKTFKTKGHLKRHQARVHSKVQ